MIGGGGVSGGYQNLQVMLTADNSNLKRVLTQSGGYVNAFVKQTEGAARGSSSWGKALAVGVAGGALAAGAGLIYAAAKALEFDKAMRNVNSLAGLSESELAKLEQRVISMSTRLPQSATTLAEGLYDITSSGFQGADAMRVLDSAALSASAGLTTTDVSARAIAATLNAYGLNAREAADVSDVLFQTVNAGVISFDELAGNLGDVVGGAAAAKVEIDEVGSAIAAMTLAGIGGAESTTSLNSLLQKIIQPSKELAALYGELGYESGAAALEQDGLRVVMERIRESTGGNITELLKLFPEIRAARGALALMANEGENYARVAGQIEDKNARAGSTQRTFNEQMKAAGNQITLAKNQVDAFALRVGVKLLPAVVDAIEGARGMGAAVADAGGQLVDTFGPGVMDLVASLGDLLQAAGHVGTAVWSMVEPFAKLGLGATATAVEVLAAVLGPLAEVLAENEGAAVVLAVALAVTLAGGATRAATALAGYLVLALVNAIGAMGAAASAARALGAAMLAAAPAVAVVGSIAAVVVAWQSYNKAADSVAEANEAVQKSLGDWDLEGAAKGISDLRAGADELNDRMADLGEASGLGDLADDWLRVDKNFRTSALLDGDVEGKLASAEDRFAGLVQGAIYLEQELGGVNLSAEQYARLMDDVEGRNGPDAQASAWAELGAVLDKFGPRLQELGADFTNGIQQADIQAVSRYMEELGGTSAQTAHAQEGLVSALGQVDAAMGNTAKAADELDNALDELMGAAMGADEAGILWRKGLVELESELRRNGGAIRGQSAAAGESRLAVQSQVEALQDLLVAQARNGAGAGRLTATMWEGRNAIIAAGKAANISAGEMNALLNRYKLTPDVVSTLIQQHGGEGVKAMLRQIQGEADKTGKKKPVVGVGVLTKEAFKQLNEVDSKVKYLKGTKIPISPKVEKKGAEADLASVGKKADEVDKKKVDVPTSAPGAPVAKQQIDAVKASADALDGKVINVTTVHSQRSKKADGGYHPGGVFSFAAGGSLPDQAKIQAGAGRGLVQWAEAETGGEAFIPLAPAKRARSVSILEQVAARFGLELLDPDGAEAFASGGFRFSYPPFKYKKFNFRKKHKSESQKEYQREKEKAKREYQRERERAKRDHAKERADARDQAWAQWRENTRLAQTASGLGEGSFSVQQGDAATTIRDLNRSKEAQAQAAAQLAANRSKNKYDTAADFYKAPTTSANEYLLALKKTEQATRAWGATMSKVSQSAGADVVQALQGMGEDGEAIVTKMAGATTAQMKAMAAELRRIQLDAFKNDLTQDNAALLQFNQNLMALTGRGRADLAAKFAGMGYEQAGTLAAAAVGMSDAELASLAGQVTTNAALTDTEKQTAALQLAALLQGSGGRLGVMGLAEKAGKPLADVLGLLTTYEAAVFGRLPAGAMAQVRADQALLAQGKQPSGLADGGIVLGSKAGDGLYYQWAEKSSGGESLIPLGADKRARALRIWEATGRMIGAGGAAGGGTITVVQPGAVTVRVDASGQPLTAAQVQAIADGAADRAMAGLAQSLNNSRR